MKFLVRTGVTAAALGVAAYLVPGIRFVPPAYGYGAEVDRVIAVLLTAVALGVANALVRPIIFAVSLPITCVTLGLFILVINGLMLLLVSFLPVLGFQVDGLFSAIVGGLIVSVVSFALNAVVR